MFPKEIADIILKYQSKEDEISTINAAIVEIIYQLTLINGNITKRLQFLVNDINTSEEEEQLLSDSIAIRKFISTLKEIDNSKILDSNFNNNILPDNSPAYPYDYIDLYICYDNICPSCEWKMTESIIQYTKIRKMGNIKNNITIQTCSGCNRQFVINYDLDGIDVTDSNIRIHRDYYVADELSFNDVIVLSTVIKCTLNEHTLTDIYAKIPVIENDGTINYICKNISYCKECNKYIMLKNDFYDMADLVACQVIDQTVLTYPNTDDEIDINQKQSVLYKYGYNVKSKDNLSDKQRHMILALIVESGVQTRTQISSHLDTLIERGSKIPKWREATNKWKQDRHYISAYKTENLPKIVTEKLILKYHKKE